MDAFPSFVPFLSGKDYSEVVCKAGTLGNTFDHTLSMESCHVLDVVPKVFLVEQFAQAVVSPLSSHVDLSIATHASDHET